MMLSWMEKIPDQVGFLVLNADGGVMSSGGELENEERIGEIIRKMVYCADRRDLLPTDNNDPINRMSKLKNGAKIRFNKECSFAVLCNTCHVLYNGTESLELTVYLGKYYYVVTLSSQKIFISKREYLPVEPVVV